MKLFFYPSTDVISSNNKDRRIKSIKRLFKSIKRLFKSVYKFIQRCYKRLVTEKKKLDRILQCAEEENGYNMMSDDGCGKKV